MATIADVSNVGNVLAGTASVTGVVTMSAVFIIYHLANQYTDMFNMEMSQYEYAIGGISLALVLSQLAAAYAAVQAIDAVSKTASGFFYNYRGGSAAGNFMGLYELFASLSYLTWTLVISVVGYIAAGLIFQYFIDRAAGAAQGFYGAALGANDGYKTLALGAIIGGGAWVASVALGDSATKLLGFYDNYDTKSEGYNYDGSERDTDGTSITYDLTFHILAFTMYSVVAAAIWLGGIIFGFVNMTPSQDFECVTLDQSVKDHWAYVLNKIAKQTNYDACLLSVQSSLDDPKYASQKGHLSRCENAQFLFTAGNTKEYSMNYARSYTQPQLQALICSQFKANN